MLRALLPAAVQALCEETNLADLVSRIASCEHPRAVALTMTLSQPGNSGSIIIVRLILADAAFLNYPETSMYIAPGKRRGKHLRESFRTRLMPRA